MKDFPNTPVYYNEEIIRKEEFIKEHVALEKIRENNNKHAGPEQYLTTVDYKASTAFISKVTNSFVHNK
jgi:hypothetical protein